MVFISLPHFVARAMLLVSLCCYVYEGSWERYCCCYCYLLKVILFIIQITMWKPMLMAKLVRQFSHLQPVRAQPVFYIHSQTTVTKTGEDIYLGGPISKRQIGENVSRNEKVNFLVRILNELNDDSKESVYNALDAWVAWEKDFPIGRLRQALVGLEKEQQWHRIIHVIKWMLSKGQGTTIGTYGQLVRALDMDHRVEEAHEVWVKKLAVDLHSVPWQLCHQMISVYYRNNMMERVIKLFKGLEAFDRKPRDKKIVKKVGDAYEILGLVEEKERVLEKYKSLFNETSSSKRPTRTSKKKSKG
ncbi:hypothetical protein QVD17_04055 [Tagetes erecta]|uniref:Pentatricopeptide repeat-containing protein n=1 Tax=Tagetes erecta TaxID=13708 RepID=A0AAD8LCF0_TARER|nr:hypothetical protein QVD17_04055 [Tagetes erecta]